MSSRTTPLLDRGGDTQWRKLRKRVIQRDGGRCVVCSSSERLQVDHIVERHDGGTDALHNLQTLCIKCHQSKSQAARRARANAAAVTQSDRSMQRATTPGPMRSAHTRNRLDGTEPPGDPRFWPDPHPDRAGSRVDELRGYARDAMGIDLLPWQEMVADRLLEVDASGRYLWSRAIVLVPRQSGKSTLLAALCEWNASTGRAVLSTSAKLHTVQHLMRATQLRLREDPAFNVKLRQDQPEINWPGAGVSSARWISQAANAMLGRGFTAQLAVVDEVQDVAVEAVESLAPAMSEADDPQLLAFGTAARGPSELLNRMRDAGMRGDGVLHMEWSAPRDADPYDEETWRAASPRWTPNRLRHIRQEAKVHAEVYLRSEYLCQPILGADDPWLNLADWTGARAHLDVPDAPQVCAVEDGHRGEGASVALAWVDGDGVPCVSAFHVLQLADAWRYAATADRVRCGVTLSHEADAKAVGAKPAGRRETASALPELRRLLPDGMRWDGDGLDEQMRGLKVREDAQGALSVLTGSPSALVRCAAWALADVRKDPAPLLV